MRSIHFAVSGTPPLFLRHQISGSSFYFFLFASELECLRRLRELKADGNKIQSLDGLDRMNGLVKLSLERNDIRIVDLDQYQW